MWRKITDWFRSPDHTCCTCGQQPSVMEYWGTMPDSDEWDWEQCAACVLANPEFAEYESRPLVP